MDLLMNNMKWKHPPIIKIYEALGAVADGRINVDGHSAKVYSSSGNKFYEVSYDPEASSIMANDNGSYWQGYLGYPSVAFLMKKGAISYNDRMGELLKGVAWKDINQKFKNDFDKTLEFILTAKTIKEKEELRKFTEKVMEEIVGLSLSLLGPKIKPPKGY